MSYSGTVTLAAAFVLIATTAVLLQSDAPALGVLQLLAVGWLFYRMVKDRI